MRVLVVTIVHDPEDARVRHRQLRALIEAGMAVEFAAPFSDYGRDVPSDVTGIDVPRATGRRRWKAIRAATAVLREHGPAADVVLVHDPELLLAVRRAGTALHGHARVIWDMHEDPIALVSLRRWVPVAARPMVRAIVRRILSWAERSVDIIVAERAYNALLSRPRPVVPNAVRVPSAVATSGTERVVYLGTLTAQRGAGELVAVGRALAGEVVLDVIGTAHGRTADELRDAERDGALVWHGFVPSDRALGMLDGATAGLSLLHDEPNYAHSEPTKIMEYMAHGVPVVTTPNPASRDLVDEARAGVVVPFDDPAAVVSAVRRLVADPGARAAMALAGHQYAQEHFDWSRIAAAFVAIVRGDPASTPDGHH